MANAAPGTILIIFLFVKFLLMPIHQYFLSSNINFVPLVATYLNSKYINYLNSILSCLHNHKVLTPAT